MRPEAMRGADRDDEIRVARIRDADAVVRLARRPFLGRVFAVALIAGRGDDHDAGCNDALALVADGSASAGVIRDVVRDGEAEVHAVYRDVIVRRVEEADEL